MQITREKVTNGGNKEIRNDIKNDNITNNRTMSSNLICRDLFKDPQQK